MSLISDFQKNLSDLEKKFKEAQNAYTDYKIKVKSKTVQKNELEQSRAIFVGKMSILNSAVQSSLNLLKQGDKSVIPFLFAYLSVKNRYYRSGYIKERICKALKKVELNSDEMSMLGHIILENLIYAGREITELIKLIPKIDKVGFRNSLMNLPFEKEYVRNRVQRVLDNYY